MIKYFCDCCHAELNRVNQSDWYGSGLGISLPSTSSDGAARSLSIKFSYDRRESSDICDECLIQLLDQAKKVIANQLAQRKKQSRGHD